jgi:diguanylate cyclase (GGDEF)-like protein
LPASIGVDWPFVDPGGNSGADCTHHRRMSANKLGDRGLVQDPVRNDPDARPSAIAKIPDERVDRRFAKVMFAAMLAPQALMVASAWTPVMQAGFWYGLGFAVALIAGPAVAVEVVRRHGREVTRRVSAINEMIHSADLGARRADSGPAPNCEIAALADSVEQLVESVTQRERRILESALSDPLTGLPNRALLADRIRHLIAVSQRTRSAFAIGVLDLDRFKVVNDTLGHSTGDALLREVSSRIQKALRDCDSVARLGGDEFVLLISGDAEVARVVSRRILELMREPFRHNDQVIDVGASIGLAIYPEHGQDDVTLLRHADSAMYRAKRSRTGAHVFDGDSGALRHSYLSMLGEMREALEERQFVLDYQPKLVLATGRIGGFEGLVRWNHPLRGRVPPGEFIPFAEQTGFMRDITRWVVEEGARFSRELTAAGLDLRVSVNVSALDIENPEFAKMVMEVLRRHPIDPKRLCLEITETGVVSESETAMKNLNLLSRLGVTLSVDDFGTGYATLSQLQQLPVNELKIDRSFVSGINKERGNLTIVRSTIELGKQLGLKVIAEGVETAQEMRSLATLGCDEIQGYFLAKPMRAEEVIDWVKMRHALYSGPVHALQ